MAQTTFFLHVLFLFQILFYFLGHIVDTFQWEGDIYIYFFAKVWNHFDAVDECPGKCVGVNVRLDNGVMGFIHLKVCIKLQHFIGQIFTRWVPPTSHTRGTKMTLRLCRSTGKK